MREIRSVVILLLVATAWMGVPVAAQPAGVSLTGIIFDEDANVYRLDVFVAETSPVGSLRATLWNEQGIEVKQVTVALPAVQQRVTVEAGDLVQGHTYRVEVMLLDLEGNPLLSERGDPLSDDREFVHGPDPSGVEINGLLFSLDRDTEALTVAADTVAANKITAYRVILRDQDTNVAVTTQQFFAIDGSVLSVDLAEVPEGAYVVTVQALDDAGVVLATAEDDFAYRQPQPILGELRFRFDEAAGLALVDFEVAEGDRVGAYRLTLVDPTTNEVVAVQIEESAEAPPMDLSLAGLSGGEYGVTVEALGEGSQILASAAGETFYEPPPAPGLLAVAMAGLRDNPWIPIAIGAIVLGVAGALVVRSWLENRVTGTPVLQHEGLRASRSEGLPLNRTLVGQTAVQLTGHTTSSTGKAAPPRLLMTLEAYPEDGRLGEQIPVARFPYTMGRGDCDLILAEDPGVSRRHAELRFGQRGLYIIDLLSSNGTYVNDVRIAADTPHSLDPAKPVEIRLGKRTRLRLAQS